MCHAVLVDLDLITVAGNVDDVFDLQIYSVQNYFVHRSFSLLYFQFVSLTCLL